MHTRGIRKNDDDEAIEQLSKVSFLPPWSIHSLQASEGVQAQETPHHETMMPFPTLCLELIRLRLNIGYYRQPAGIVNDLTEAYVTSVLYVLSGPASRKKSRLSIRKISKHLLSAKNINQVATFVLPKEAKKKAKKKAKVATTVDIPSATSVEVAEEPGTCSMAGFSDEEAALITRIDKIRRLYATAIVCVTEFRYVEHIFGLSRKERREPEHRVVASNGGREALQLAAVQRIRYILTSLARDPCRNRFGFYGLVKLKVSCDEQIVSGEKETLPETANPLSASVPNGTVGDQPTLEDSIKLRWQDFEINDDLARCLFGRPGRMSPCVRCQVYKISFLTCRVRRFHSNPDFGFMENFKNFGGVNGLLRPLLMPDHEQTPMPVQIQTGNSNSQPGSAAMTTEDIGPDATQAKAQSCLPSPAGESENKDAKKPARQGEVVNSDPLSDSLETNESPPHNPTQVDGDQDESKDEDPIENLEKAESAINLASYLFRQAHLLADAPVRLGETFIKNYFPVDPEDGHYAYCIICGLSGNVLCCDGCSNVVHTHCVGLSEIPDEDWFCEKCVSKKGCSSHSSIPLGTPHQSKTSENSDTVQRLGGVSASSDTAVDSRKVSDSAHVCGDDLVSTDEQSHENKVSEGGSDKKDEKTIPPQSPEAKETPRPDISDESFDEKASVLATILSDLKSCRMPPPALPTNQPPTDANENSNDTEQISAKNNPEVETRDEDCDGGKEYTNENHSEDATMTIPIGTIFRKNFEGLGDFQGKVVELPTNKQPYYHVEYEDGDSEDLSLSDLLELLPPGECEKYCKSRGKKGDTLSTSKDPPRRQELSSAKLESIVSNEAKSAFGGMTSRRRRASRPPNRFTGEASVLYRSPNKRKQQDDSRLDNNHVTTVTDTPTQKRGRPRTKTVDPSIRIENSVTSEDPPKRRRGRPRKHAISKPMDGDDNIKCTPVSKRLTMETPKRVGRPRKRPIAYNDTVEEQSASKDGTNFKSTKRGEDNSSSAPEPQRKRRRVASDEVSLSSDSDEVLSTSLRRHSFKKKISKADGVEEVREEQKKRGRRPNRLEARRQEENNEAPPALDVLAEVHKLAEEDPPSRQRRSARRRIPKIEIRA